MHRELSEELDVNVQIHYKFTEFDYQYPSHGVHLISYICSMSDQEIKLVDHDLHEWINISDVDFFDFLSADDEILNKLKNNSDFILMKISESFS